MKKFEVGKKYKSTNAEDTPVLECVYTNDWGAAFVFPGGALTQMPHNYLDTNSSIGHFTEFVPKIVRYVKLNAVQASGGIMSGNFDRYFSLTRDNIHTHKVTFDGKTGEFISVEKL